MIDDLLTFGIAIAQECVPRIALNGTHFAEAMNQLPGGTFGNFYSE